MEQASAGLKGEYLCIQAGSSFPARSSTWDDEKCHQQTPGGVSLHSNVASEMLHPCAAGDLKYPAGKGHLEAGHMKAINESVLEASIVPVQSVLSISKVLIAIVAFFFYCLDVYKCTSRTNYDSKESENWDMVAFGLCIAGIILCLVDLVCDCRPPKWPFAAAAITTDHPSCIVVVNHQGSIYVNHVTCDSAHSPKVDSAQFRPF